MAKPKTRISTGYHHGSLQTELIIQAVALVQKHGSVEFNLRELAEACGVSIAAVYRHYASKNELLVAIAVDGFTQLHRMLAGAYRPQGKAGDSLGRIGRAYIEFAIGHEGYFRVMFNRTLAELPEFKPTATLRDQTFMTLVNALAETRKGTARSSWAACQDPNVLTHWGMLHGLSILWLDRNLELNSAEFARVLDGLFGPGG